MKHLMLPALLIGAGLMLGAAPAPPQPTLCRVIAVTERLSWASSLRAVTVSLDPACPPNGVARIRLGGYGGPGSRALGPVETLNRDYPRITWAAQPTYRTVLWLAKSNKSYPVPLRGVNP